MTDPRGLAPAGSRVPAEDDWSDLRVNVLVNTAIDGGQMKSANLWMAPNPGTTNSSHFTGLPGGFRQADPSFAGSMGYYGQWWSDFARRLAYNKANPLQPYTNVNIAVAMHAGRSVCCVRQ